MMYGGRPNCIGKFNPEWHELMHWLYLPVVMKGDLEIRLPPNLEFTRMFVQRCMDNAHVWWTRDKYVYLTAHRGWVNKGEFLNRPGWHTDGFGTDDINYIWSDKDPTQFDTDIWADVPDDHIKSMEHFDKFAFPTWTAPVGQILRLDQRHIHRCAPAASSGWRSFIKVSVSTETYALSGNSHNHLFDYDWPLRDRLEVRNDPAGAMSDR